MAHTRSVLTLFFLLFLLAAGVFLFLLPKKEEEVYVVYTAVIEADAALLDTLRVGDAVIDARGKEPAGEILKISCDGCLREDAFGVYTEGGRVTLALTVGGKGVRGKRGVSIGTLTPRVGEAIYLLGRARLEGLCVKVGAV